MILIVYNGSSGGLAWEEILLLRLFVFGGIHPMGWLNNILKWKAIHSVHAFRLSPSRNPVGFVLGSNDDNKLWPNRFFSSMNTWNWSIRISWFMSWPVADFFLSVSSLQNSEEKLSCIFFYIQFFIDTIEKSNIQVYHDASRYVQEGFSSSVQPLLAWLEAHRDENPCECWATQWRPLTW